MTRGRTRQSPKISRRYPQIPLKSHEIRAICRDNKISPGTPRTNKATTKKRQGRLADHPRL